MLLQNEVYLPQGIADQPPAQRSVPQPQPGLQPPKADLDSLLLVKSHYLLWAIFWTFVTVNAMYDQYQWLFGQFCLLFGIRFVPSRYKFDLKRTADLSTITDLYFDMQLRVAKMFKRTFVKINTAQASCAGNLSSMKLALKKQLLQLVDQIDIYSLYQSIGIIHHDISECLIADLLEPAAAFTAFSRCLTSLSMIDISSL